MRDCSSCELRSLFLFESLTDEQLDWLCERGHIEEIGVGRIYSEGEPATSLYVLLEGAVRLAMRVGSDEVELNRTDQRGVYAGAWYAYLGDRIPQIYEHSLDSTSPCLFFVLPAEALRDMIRSWFPMAVHMLEGLFFGMTSINQTVGQRERLQALGSLSAGLTHELNNPASAAVRAAASLREASDILFRTMLEVSNDNPTEPALASLVAVQQAAFESLSTTLSRTPTEMSEAEDGVVDWMDRHSITEGRELGPVLAQAGIDQKWLETFRSTLGETNLERSTRWLTAIIESESLIKEIEDATARISSLVSAAKQYSQLDRAPYGAVNIQGLLDSTLVMFGARIGGSVKLVKEYDRALPAVDGYGAELNQVWTNLIDNALSAINGNGTLTLRTSTDGDMIVVVIADTGPGIAPEIRQRIFEPFFTTKAVGQGTGLGLDISWRIVTQRHHGQLLVRSEPGNTEFEVRLPVERAGH